MEVSQKSWETLTEDVNKMKKDLDSMQRELRDLKLVVYGSTELGIVGIQTTIKQINDKLDDLKINVLSIQDNRKFIITMVGLFISMIGSVGALAGVIFVIAQNAQKVAIP